MKTRRRYAIIVTLAMLMMSCQFLTSAVANAMQIYQFRQDIFEIVKKMKSWQLFGEPLRLTIACA